MLDEKGLREALSSHLEPHGFETHPFLVGWYNSMVAEKFRLPQTNDTLAFVVISRPSMFEKTFVPFLAKRRKISSSSEFFAAGDPLDQCMKETLDSVAASVASLAGRISVIHDFELWPNRRPKVLVQTAAHVSGAVTFFRPDDVEDQTLLAPVKASKVYSVCLHPELGGWFAIRAVIIAEEVKAPQLSVSRAKISLSQEEIAHLLVLYNVCWQDWRFRDVIPAEETYSDQQKDYFKTPPAERETVVQKIVTNYLKDCP